MRRLLCCLIAGILLWPALGALPVLAAAGPGHVDSSLFNGLNWRLIGPFRGGRALAVTGVPGEPEHFYFGSVDGGVWESTNAGRTWNPIFDNQSIASIGAIAIAPSDTKTLYVGTGEADMRSDIAYGDGMYKSTDAGKTWTHAGLDDTKQIGKIVVDPHDANTVYVAALGHAYGPNAERGVFKTTDGGKSWSKVLYKDENTGAIDLSMDPSDPQTIYATLWQTRRPPWNVYPPSSGPGSGIYKTSDGGKTWTQLTGGLPARMGHAGIAVAPSQPSRVYAIVDTASDVPRGGVYRSDDRGVTWTHLAGGTSQLRIWKRGWYFGGITVDPKNPDVVYLMNTATYRSSDGGKTFDAIKGSPGGDDYHTLWIDSNDSNRMILGSDQGTVVSLDYAKTWSSWLNQPTAQFYHVATDNRFPYWVYGAQQDSGAMAVRSQSIHSELTTADWRPIDVGGESGYIAPDPNHPGKIFGGSSITYEDLETGEEQNVDPTTAYPGQIWRQTWTLPVVVSRADPHALYAGRQQIFRSHDAGHTWKIISPDLTRPAGENMPANLDTPTLDDSTGLPRRGVVYAIAPSPIQARRVWAGTDDGYVWMTTNDGGQWSNVTPRQLTPWSKVGIVEASHFSTATAYVAVDRHRLNDYRPYIYRTTDDGKTWTSIAQGIPDGSFVNVVREDPKQRGLLYAGTERGIYVSFDDGEHWQTLQRNLPVTSVRDIDVHGDDVVIATHGRAFWIMDNVSPLRQMGSAVGAATTLFTPQTALRVRRAGGAGGGIADEGTPVQLDEPRASNPPVGAAIDYALRGNGGSPVSLEIRDASGKTIRRYSSTDRPQTTDPSTVDIAPWWLTQPPVPESTEGAHRFVWDYLVNDEAGALAPPGRYTVRLVTKGQHIERPLVLHRDPRLNATDADLLEQYRFATLIQARQRQIAAARERANGLLKRSGSNPKLARELRESIIGVPPASDPDDSVGKPAHDFTSLRYLDDQYSGLFAAEQSGDAAPTADMRTGFAKLNQTLNATLARLRRLSPG